MLTKIKKWIQDPNASFEEGLNLFNVVKRNKSKDEFFAKADKSTTSLHYRMLQSELENCMRILSNNPKLLKQISVPVASDTSEKSPDIRVNPVVIPKAGTDKPKIIKSRSVDYDKLPGNLKAKYDDNISITNEMKSLHAKMRVSKNADERKKLVNEIAEKEEIRDKNWEAIDLFIAEQNNPAKKVELSQADQANVLMKKVNAAKRYLSEFRDSKDTDKQKKCADYIAFLKEHNQKVPEPKKTAVTPAKKDKKK